MKMRRNPTVGILAVQGDYAEHRETLGHLGVDSRLVKHAVELEGLDGLIMPGGESTTMLKLLIGESLMEPIKDLLHRGGALYGTCAGAILLARKATSPEQPSLGLLNISIERNGYGRQLQSHVAVEPCPALGEPPLEMVFIRAPIIREVGPDVDVLARHRGDPVFVRQGRIMATTFHPELGKDDRVHSYFVRKIIRSPTPAALHL
jgi:5'-phosphate synthase pdxT subunit